MLTRLLIKIGFGFSLMVLSLSIAQAQWGWRENGRTVFSDQPPPRSIPDKDIIRRPSGARAPSETTPVASTPASTTSTASTTTTSLAPAPKLSSKDAELEKRKKDLEAKEAAKKKEDEQKLAAARKDNCERAKRSKASLDSGVRIATTNDKGEREIMSDAQRAAESKRLQEIIASDCS